jgi:hypothetical protein
MSGLDAEVIRPKQRALPIDSWARGETLDNELARDRLERWRRIEGRRRRAVSRGLPRQCDPQAKSFVMVQQKFRKTELKIPTGVIFFVAVCGKYRATESASRRRCRI